MIGVRARQAGANSLRARPSYLIRSHAATILRDIERREEERVEEVQMTFNAESRIRATEHYIERATEESIKISTRMIPNAASDLRALARRNNPEASKVVNAMAALLEAQFEYIKVHGNTPIEGLNKFHWRA